MTLKHEAALTDLARVASYAAVALAFYEKGMHTYHMEYHLKQAKARLEGYRNDS